MHQYLSQACKSPFLNINFCHRNILGTHYNYVAIDYVEKSLIKSNLLSGGATGVELCVNDSVFSAACCTHHVGVVTALLKSGKLYCCVLGMIFFTHKSIYTLITKI